MSLPLSISPASEVFPFIDVAGEAAERGAAAPAVSLPCLFVTTASKTKEEEAERPPMPGPRKKQAQAFTDNLGWLEKTFGRDHIGFLTLTVGDKDADGKFHNLRDRKEAQRRFHSLLTNELAKRYKCGATITERHENLGLHLHLAVVTEQDIRGDINFAACFPEKGLSGKPVRRPNYSTANAALKKEWEWFRRVCKKYGFGRHQLQPMRENGEALGRYLGTYLRKDWEHRLPEDKGARCIRYFGHWSKDRKQPGERPKPPVYNSRTGWLTPRARVWREMVKQVVIVLKSKGANITEENMKDIAGRRWAWHANRLFASVRFVEGEWQDETIRKGIVEHNLNVAIRFFEESRRPGRDCWWDVTQLTLDHLRPAPDWKKQAADLQLAKDREFIERIALRREKRREREHECQKELLRETAVEAGWIQDENLPF